MAGDVNVAEVIFEKIDRCRIFVADITTTTPEEAPRPAPNPNVLVEYGRASVRPGSLAVVQIFNEAFGDWETERPFDLRHRRKPVLYRLAADASAEERKTARKALAAELTQVFRQILNTGQPAAPLPALSEFEPLRQLYMRTTVGERVVAVSLRRRVGAGGGEPVQRVVGEGAGERVKKSVYCPQKSCCPQKSLLSPEIP